LVDFDPEIRPLHNVKKKHKIFTKMCKKFTIGRIAFFSTKQNNELTNDNLENLIDIFEGIKTKKLKL
jgi:hypothetical protein